jgi:hypothetical protein
VGVGEIDGELVPTHLLGIGGGRFGPIQSIDEVIDPYRPVSVVPEVFKESSPATISDECKTRIETALIHDA